MAGVSGKQHAELLKGVDSFTRGDRDANSGGHLRHFVEIVRLYRVFVEHGMARFDFAAQGNRFRHRELPVNLNTKIHFTSL